MYTLSTAVPYCAGSNGTVLIMGHRSSYAYKLKTYDELIDSAKKILAGRALTETERKAYLVD